LNEGDLAPKSRANGSHSVEDNYIIQAVCIILMDITLVDTWSD
jgi:hypothetical protein